jgi:TetR/AcrR family transcriptional repressor of mexJK operon
MTAAARRTTERGATRKTSGKPSPGRGRPTAARVAEIDSAIRAAARQTFFDAGFEAASMDAIAAAAHVSKGTLYARYDGKEALFRAVVEDLLATLSDRAGRYDHLLGENLEERLRHHAHVLVSVFAWREYALAARLIANASHSFPEIEQVWQELGARRYVAFIAEDLARASPGRNADWEFLANLFLHAITGWYRTALVHGPVPEPERAAYCDKVIATILASIG